MNNEYVRNLPDNQNMMSLRLRIFKRLHIDYFLFILLTTISCYGLIVLYSASGQSTSRVIKQAIYMAIAYTGMLVAAQFKLKTIKTFSPVLYVLAITALFATPFFGVDVNGATRWLDLGFIRFQPSELMKIALPLTVAAYLSDKKLPPSFFSLLTSFAILLLPFMLIVIQPDLGTSILVASSGFFVIWLAGLQWIYIFFVSLILLVSAWPIWQFGLHTYQKNRILTMFNPESDRLGAGWNIIQSKTAIGSGGLQGKGWLQGTQSHLDFLPESHTDFIIAVLAEEFGLIGVMALYAIYFLIVLRGAYIAVSAKDMFSRLVAGSITFTFLVYVCVNMGMVAGMLPVVGVPLPLVSYGGTAMVTMMLSFGILMAISSESKS